MSLASDVLVASVSLVLVPNKIFSQQKVHHHVVMPFYRKQTITETAKNSGNFATTVFYTFYINTYVLIINLCK